MIDAGFAPGSEMIWEHHYAVYWDLTQRAYREAIRTCGRDAVLLYNLGVLLDDLHRTVEAVVAYEQALAVDPKFADCHYNLALAYERLRRPKEALRHMARYRVLLAT